MIKDVLDILIQDSLSMRITNRVSQNYINGLEYAVQFKTIGLTVPRRYGKSSYIKEFVRTTSDSVAIVVPNNLMKQFYDTNNSRVKLYSVPELNNIIYNRDKPKLENTWVFFDDVKISPVVKYEYTDYFNNYYNTLQTFVWLNT